MMPLRIAMLLAGIALPALSAASQELSKLDRQRGRRMLEVIRKDIEKHYYDPTFGGVPVADHFRLAEQRIDAAQSNADVFSAIAQALVELNDAHTFFIPPRGTVSVEYGWRFGIIGDSCYVMAVKPGSDAEAKGIRPGDVLVSINGLPMNRGTVNRISYLIDVLRPQPGLRLALRRGSEERTVDVMAKVRERKRIMDLTGADGGVDLQTFFNELYNDRQLVRDRLVSVGDVLVWKMPVFDDVRMLDDVMKKVRKHRALVLDLRSNPGGYIESVKRLTGHFFDRDVTIFSAREREKTEREIAKSRGKDRFAGPLVVLLDAASGSSSEILARIIQIEKRGTVIGDRSSGVVRQSRFHGHSLGFERVIFYGASITNADIAMSDGSRLEGKGVVPDTLLLPTPADLAEGRDPVLAYAVTLVGGQLSPEDAGRMFPREWPR